MKGSLCCTQRAVESSLRNKTGHNSQTSLALYHCREQYAGLEETSCKVTACSRKEKEIKDASPEICGGFSHPQAPKSVKGCSLSWQSSVALCMFIQGFRLCGASARAAACS